MARASNEGLEGIPTSRLELFAARVLRSERIAWAALVLFLVLVLPLFICMPLCCDVTLFDVQARSLLRGELVYKEFMIIGPANIDLAHAATRAVVGWSMEGIRCVDSVIVCGIVGVLAGCIVPGLSRAGRVWLALTLGLLYFGTSEWCHCQPDTWMLLPAAGALWLRCRQLRAVMSGAPWKGLAGRAVLEGLLWGLVCTIKPFACLAPAACVVVTAILAWRAGWAARKRLALDLGAMLLGGALAAVVSVGWVYFSGNWPYFQASRRAAPSFAEYYQRSTSWESRSRKLWTRLWPWNLINLLAVPTALVILVRALTTRRTALRHGAPETWSQAMLAACYLGWFTQANFVQHQFDYHLVPVLLLGVALLASQVRLIRFRLVRVVVLPALLLWAIAIHPLLQPSRLSVWLRCWREGGTPELRERLGSLEKDAVFISSWEDLDRVERFLRGRGVRDGELTCWSNSSLAIYSDLRLKPSNRFVMISSWCAFMPSRSAEVIREVKAGPQRYIVTDLEENANVPHERAPTYPGPSEAARRHYPWNQPVIFRAGRYFVHEVSAREADAPEDSPATSTPADAGQATEAEGPSLKDAPGLLLRLAAVIALMAACAVGPGLFFVRWLRWPAPETLCAAMGLSYVIIYLGEILIYFLRLPAAAHYGLTAVCLLLTAATWRQLVLLLRRAPVRRQLGGCALLFLWGALLTSLVRHFSGGAGAFDWLEHYERSLYLLHVPRDYLFLRISGSLAARPPLQNAVAAHYLAQVGTDFPVYQAIVLFLNVLVYFPLGLMARWFAGRQRYSRFLLLGLLALSPMLWWNSTFTWTKVFTCFYVILGLWFYLAAWRKGDRVRMIAAFCSLSAGCLVHYSAAPYALVLGLHYLVAVFPRRQHRWREIVGVGLGSTALLSTWLLGSLAALGARETFASNTAAQALGASSPAATIGRVFADCGYTLVPHPLRMLPNDLDRALELQQASTIGRLRDHFILACGGNAFLSIGCVGGLLVLYLLVRDLRSLAGRDRPAARFWVWFLVGSAFIGIAAHPYVVLSGVWNISGQSLTYTGLAYFAARFATLPGRLRVLALVGCALDFALGIFAQIRLENLAFRFGTAENGMREVLPSGGAETLSLWALTNAGLKAKAQVDYVGDFLAPLASPLLWLLILAFGLISVRLVMIAFAWGQSAVRATLPAYGTKAYDSPARPRAGPAARRKARARRR